MKVLRCEFGFGFEKNEGVQTCNIVNETKFLEQSLLTLIMDTGAGFAKHLVDTTPTTTPPGALKSMRIVIDVDMTRLRGN